MRTIQQMRQDAALVRDILQRVKFTMPNGSLNDQRIDNACQILTQNIIGEKEYILTLTLPDDEKNALDNLISYCRSRLRKEWEDIGSNSEVNKRMAENQDRLMDKLESALDHATVKDAKNN